MGIALTTRRFPPLCCGVGDYTFGLAIVSVPFMAAEHEVPHDYLRFTSYGIRELLERAGFEQIDAKKQFGFWSVIGEMIYWRYHRTVTGTRWSASPWESVWRRWLRFLC
jgi:hypothetical protein